MVCGIIWYMYHHSKKKPKVPSICSKCRQALPDNILLTLTDRQKQVLARLMLGECNKEIAVSLGIEVRTVKAHISRLLLITGSRNRVQMALRAVQLGLAEAKA